MNSIPIASRDQLITELQAIEAQTENIFMVLAESLPLLVAEMKASLSQSQEAITCMDSGGRVGCDGEVEISKLVSAIRNEMEQGATTFRTMSQRDDELFNRLQNGISQLETISGSIADIRRDSEDMELVSLNAMTVALKAGTAGRAFSYITEELKRLANRTIGLSEEISKRGGELINNFRHLEQSLDDTRTFQGDLIAGLQNRIAAGLNELETAVQATVSNLTELREESAELQRPVNGMMEAIQLQDLIRQSIDHIVLALKAIKPESDLVTDIALLDELAFTRKIPALASRLIDDVAEQIDNSVQTFLALTTEAKQKLSELQSGQQSFLSGNGTATVSPNSASSNTPEEHDKNDPEEAAAGSTTALDARFRHASQMLLTLLEDLEHNIKKKESLVTRSGAITKEVEELESRFQTFTTLVNRFHSIDIASRIEVAKQEVLRQMGSSAEQMTTLTRTIESDVNRSLEATQEFIKSTSVIIESHHAHFQQENRFVHEFSSSIRQRYEALIDSREAVVHVVGDFSLFTDGFVNVFATSTENGQRLSALSDRIRGLKNDLTRMQDVIDRRYDEELAAQGIDSWTIENDRLKEIIERFTIFTHKQQAGDLVGLDVEEGVEAGDITLF